MLQYIWHVDPLLGNGREISNYTTAVAKVMVRMKQQRNGVFCAVCADDCAPNNGIRHATAKQQLDCYRGTVFSARSVPRCYMQGR
jgi:hypothetical protein